MESSQILTIAAALFVFLSVGLVYFGVNSARARASTPEMEDRLDRYGHVIDVASSDGGSRATAMVSDRLETAAKGTSVGEQTGIALARADLKMTIGEFLGIRIGAGAGGFMLGLILGRAQLGMALLFGIGVGILGWKIPLIYLRMRARRRQKAFINQLGDTIGLMANSLRAGYSLLQTMELVSREAPSPMNEEFRRVVREVGLGVSPQDALNHLLRRVPSEDLDLMVSAINIQHEIGGNLGQILDVIGETIRERVRIKGEIGVLTAQAQMSANVITGLPVALAVGLYFMNKEYLMGLFAWPWVCMPIGAAILLVMGYMVMRKIVTIEI
ncbi:MAG: type II secretion system F family protein [Thermomicrobiales bacterium]